MTAEPAPNQMHVAADVGIKSPLINSGFKYYQEQINHPVRLKLGAAELASELLRIHTEAKAQVLKIPRSHVNPILRREGGTWGAYVQYLAFHAAYHAGQVYSARHIFGEHTPNN